MLDRLAALTISIALSLTACGERLDDELPPPGPDGFPRRVELPGGSKVRLDHRPMRVVAATTTAVDYVASLVGPERVAAVCEQAFESSILVANQEPWSDKPRFEFFEVEPTLAQDPDLVLCSAFSNPDTVAVLGRTGLAIARLDEPNDFEQVFANLIAVGALLGTEVDAETLATTSRETIERIRTESPGRGRRALYLSRNGADSWTAGSKTLPDAMLRTLGLVNLGARLGSGPCALDLETLIAFDPEILIIAESNRPAFDDERLASLDALKEGKLIALPGPLFQTTSHRIVETTERLAEALR